MDINERRHQLHEVIRLSDEFVVNDLDMPLIIKVASIQKREYISGARKCNVSTTVLSR
jgi:hypothetical protein